MKNPQAFPSVVPTFESNKVIEGMTLRDYFAAAALSGLMANPNDKTGLDMVERSFQLADAMLAEREKQ